MSRIDKQIAQAKQIKITSLYTGELRNSGKYLIGKCPLHNDTGNPNFRIYPETNSYYCFRGCGGGDVISYVMKLRNLAFKDALDYLIK